MKECKQKCLTGKFPFLETSEGTIFESAAIARFFARKATDKKLLGSNNHEAALVDQWISFAHTTLSPSCFVVYKTLFGYSTPDADAYNDALKTMKDNIRVMENALKGKNYLLGENISVADIVNGMTLLMAF